MRRHVDKVLAGHRVQHEQSLRLATGRLVHLNVTFTPRLDAATGRVVSFYVMALDRTDYKELESKMLQSQKLESLGVLAGGLAHDFNNLLVSIVGVASLAASKCEPDHEFRPALEQIRGTGEHAADLCRQLLAHSGRGSFVVEPLDLSPLTRASMALLGTLLPKNVILEAEIASDLPAIRADASQLRQVLMNLLTNAAEAIDVGQGTITVRTGRHHCDRAYLDSSLGDLGESLAEGEYVFLEVEDSGSGMDRSTRERLFDPFFTTKFTGRGLGLAAVLGHRAWPPRGLACGK